MSDVADMILKALDAEVEKQANEAFEAVWNKLPENDQTKMLPAKEIIKSFYVIGMLQGHRKATTAMVGAMKDIFDDIRKLNGQEYGAVKQKVGEV